MYTSIVLVLCLLTGDISTSNIGQSFPHASNPSSTMKVRSSRGVIPQTRYGEIPGDKSGIRFQYEESKEVGNSLWEVHVERLISQSILQMALQMDYVISNSNASTNNKDNIVFSPANIGAALSLVMLGSSGTTFTEIASVLGLVSGVDVSANREEIHNSFGRLLRKLESHFYSELSTRIVSAGAVFIQDGYPIEEQFLRKSWEIYRSEILSLDFFSQGLVAKDIINRWVENRTLGHIPQILEYPPNPSTKVIIASALYFNGAWEVPFPVEQTKWSPFYVGADRSEVVKVPMMVGGGEFYYQHDENLGCQLVGMPYKDHTATMYLVLPDTPGLEGLKRLQNVLTANNLYHLVHSATVRTVLVALPRMQLESTTRLKESLQMLGIHALFDPSQADLSKISKFNPQLVYEYAHYSTSHTNNSDTYNSNILRSGKIQFQSPDVNTNPGLYVDNILHKVTINITETGTEAAAATIVSLTRDGSHKVVRFERPFLFFIRHRTTGVTLFWGNVIKPNPHVQA